MNAWVALLIAAGFEVGFTTSMALANKGHAWANVTFLACIIASFAFLDYAVKTIPIGIGYAVWTGLGAAGTLIVSAFILKQEISPLQIGLIMALIGIVAGLKLTSPH